MKSLMIHKMWKLIQRFGRWVFGAPFQELPPEFGDPVPPEWHVFETRAEEVQHHPQGDIPAPHPQSGQRR